MTDEFVKPNNDELRGIFEVAFWFADNPKKVETRSGVYNRNEE
jgi:hypothetical protein